MESNKETMQPDSSFKPLNVFDAPSEEDVLSLNVGGTHLDVSRGTLTCMPSLLASKFSGEWDDSLVRDANGRFFIDEEPELFTPVVNYLRDYNRMLPSATYAEPPSFSDTVKQRRLERLLKSIHLKPILAFQWMRRNNDRMSVLDGSILAKVSCPCDYPGRSFDESEYVIQRQANDNRRIVSFEAEVHVAGGAECYIGWLEYTLDNDPADNLDVSSELRLELPGGLLMSFVEDDVDFPDIDRCIDLVKKADYKVHCVNHGADWYIDGALVADISEHNRLFSGLQPCIQTYRNGGSVSFQLVNVECEEDK